MMALVPLAKLCALLFKLIKPARWAGFTNADMMVLAGIIRPEMNVKKKTNRKYENHNENAY